MLTWSKIEAPINLLLLKKVRQQRHIVAIRNDLDLVGIPCDQSAKRIY